MVRAYYAPMFNLLVTQDRPGGKRTRRMKFYPEVILREKLKGWTTTGLPTFEEELRDFLRPAARASACRSRTGWDGLRAVEIAHAAYQLIGFRAPVTLSVR